MMMHCGLLAFFRERGKRAEVNDGGNERGDEKCVL